MKRNNRKYIIEAFENLKKKNIKATKDNLIKEYDEIQKENQGSYEGDNLLSIIKLPSNEEESHQYGNALANSGIYPVGLSGCFTVGVSGGCGLECYVYQNGECENHAEMIDMLKTEEDVVEYEELYEVIKE
ncbi:hypothetical protein [Clostridium neonatale]|uniref:hypothetical protein n=1 Tax=Clostridium neonatale TaxID=137838 RepID=UPI00291B35FE|nr:hypothetical protein CNEO3_1180011 [Clostridium neonatale]CAI3560531.1 hypothetical protein CNEO3_1190007 [Clostridium neonatale]CAI3701243.1 hypothetical protein CNEO3_730012 [Clostridium neonatale]